MSASEHWVRLFSQEDWGDLSLGEAEVITAGSSAGFLQVLTPINIRWDDRVP